MSDSTNTITINVLVAGFAAWLAYFFAIQKMKREWNWKEKNDQLLRATKVHRDIRATLRALIEMQSKLRKLQEGQQQVLITAHDERVDYFQAEGRLAFFPETANRIKNALRATGILLKTPILASALNNPDSMDYLLVCEEAGYTSTVESLKSLEMEIEEHIDLLAEEIEC